MNSICAVIVTYHPADEIIENVYLLGDQVNEIIIVDNGSDVAARGLLAKLSTHPKVTVVFSQVNLGLAAALNIGVKKAKADGYQWVATFDQDSKVLPNMFENMLQAYGEYPLKEKVASLSPRYRNKSSGVICGSQVGPVQNEVSQYAEVRIVITSGNLLKTGIFDVIGYFNEELFIDYIDTEYCLRCITHGYKILEVKDAFMIHDVGTPVRRKILWKNPSSSNHSALRRYYFARNAIYTYKKYTLDYPRWILRDGYTLAKSTFLAVLIEADRARKFRAFMLGCLDGVLGKMGKCARDI